MNKSNAISSLTGQVMTEIRRAILAFENEDTQVISPMMVEKRVMHIIDPEQKSPLLVGHLGRLQIRQLCRQQLIVRNQEHDDNTTRQILLSGSVFEVQLQPYYPAKREGEEVYVQRMALSLEERRLNESRLRQEAKAKKTHADALRAETDSLFPASRECAA